jgi:NAD(P)-dependent dehydrogenase (short-subunit alcohol dehydrogenase family)
MFNGLAGKSAIITGGATLLGAGVVRAFHHAGVKVMVADIDAAGGQALMDSFSSGVAFCRTDIADDAQVQACVDEAVTRHGGVNYLVNLACSYVDDGINSSRADWMTSFNVNIASAVMMLKAVRPHMNSPCGCDRICSNRWYVRKQNSRPSISTPSNSGSGDLFMRVGRRKAWTLAVPKRLKAPRPCLAPTRRRTLAD